MKPFRGAVFFVFLSVLSLISCNRNSENNPVSPIDETCTISGKIVKFRYFSVDLESFYREMSVHFKSDLVDTPVIPEQNGVYTLANVPKGKYTITPHDEYSFFGPPEVVIDVSENYHTVPDFLFDQIKSDDYIVAGKIVDTENDPVPIVQFKGMPGNTDELGYYYIVCPLKEGDKYYGKFKKGDELTVIPYKEGYKYLFIPDSLKVTITNNITVCNFTASYSGPPLHSISGRATDFEGNGMYSFVYLWNETQRIWQLLTEFTGEYKFLGLKDGNYKVECLPYSSTEYKISDTMADVILDGEDVLVPDFRADQKYTKYVLHGRIVDSGGTGISGVVVRVYFSIVIDPRYYVGETKTDNEGFYSYVVNLSFDQKATFVIAPVKDSVSFDPETSSVELQWVKGVSYGGDVIIPDIIGRKFAIFSVVDYFPLAVGSSWTYRRTEGDGEPYDTTIDVTETVETNGRTYFRLSERGPWKFTDYRIDGNDVYALSGAEEVVFLRFGVIPGTEWESGLEGNVYPRRGTFIGDETVVTPAGTFENCARFSSKITYSADSYDSYELWYSHDVGLVKSVKVIMSYGKVLEQVTDELKTYRIQ